MWRQDSFGIKSRLSRRAWSQWFLSSRTQCIRLANDLGIGHRLVPAQEAAKYRFLYLDGRLQAVPVSPPAFFKSNLLPVGARLRAMKEPVVARQMNHDGESVYDFAARRLGPVVAERMVDAMVTGIHAGDARLLSVQAAFPRLVEMEREHGSVVRALIAAKKIVIKRRGVASVDLLSQRFRGDDQRLWSLSSMTAAFTPAAR